MKNQILHGDCKVLLKSLPDNSVDSVVTDPPYELSNDGKASPNRVFFEVMFPYNDKPIGSGDSEIPLDFFLGEIFKLCFGRTIPSETSTMPISTMTFQENVLDGEKIVKCEYKPTSFIPNGYLGNTVNSKPVKGFSHCYFKLTDFAHCFQILNAVGSGFFSGDIRVGFMIEPSCFPSLFASLSSIVITDDDVRLLADSLTEFVHTGRRAEDFFMTTINLGGGTIEFSTTYSALIFFSILHNCGTKMITTNTTASSLSSVFNSCCIGLVDTMANGTFPLNVITHTTKIQSTGFMGKEWDGSKVAYDVEMWKEVYRVLKHGGHLLSFGGTRTYHRMSCAIEDAGFEIRDMIEWVYGSGFPKSLDIEKSINKMNGVEFKQIPSSGVGFMNNENDGYNNTLNQLIQVGESVEDAKKWSGYGTSLKPSHEPICVARKPISEKTVAQNVLKWGTGGINIDESRISLSDSDSKDNGRIINRNIRESDDGWGMQDNKADIVEVLKSNGRFPSNLILDGSEEVVSMFPYYTSGEMNCISQGKSYGIYGEFKPHPVKAEKSEGSASRFFKVCEFTEEDFAPLFYTAKPSGDERNRGCRRIGRNFHTTVKPLSLMKYLIKLVTPKGGIVLDPFAGSGTTLVASKELGYDYIGIEMEEEHIEIIKARLEGSIPHMATLFE